jgi:rhodanese-related sulfurtransferase
MDIPRISAAETKKLLDNGQPVVFLDCRNPQAWATADEKLPRAIRVPADEAGRHLHQIPKGQTVVAYCT